MSDAGTPSRDQQLTLKVMRLTRPAFATFPGVGTDPATPALTSDLTQGLRPLTGQRDLSSPLGASLLLPQNFEYSSQPWNIYLGETFTCYVVVHNEGSTTAKDVSIKADLQTSSQRVSLPSEYGEGVPELAPGGSLGQILTYEVNHQGQHILVCAVQYTTEGGDKQYFRKFFKFPVAKPLDVRTKFYNAESDEVYLEAQIQNLTSLPMVMERVSLDPAELYTAEPINDLAKENGEPGSVFDGFPYLNPKDTRQYLYRLSPKQGLPPKSFRGVSSIGKVDMVWRTGLGERGRLQTSPLQRMAPGTGDIRLSLHSAPSKVKLQEEFTIVCSLLNTSERALELWLDLEGQLSPSLIWTSKARRSIGVLQPGASLRLPLALLPATAGLHWISGLRLTDTLLSRTYELDEIAQVFVQN